MDKAQTRLSGSLFAIWLVMSFIVCIIVATVINVMIPYHFESTAVIASNERFNGEQMISPAQAKLIERELELARRGFGWEKIRSAVRVRKVSQGTEITVRTQDIYTSYELAGEAARRFRSVKHERELTKNPPSIKPLSEAEPVMLRDAEALRSILTRQASEIGMDNFLTVPSKAAAGNAEAA